MSADETATAATASCASIVEQLARRRRDVAERWNLGDQIALIGAGMPLPAPADAPIPPCPPEYL